MFSRRNFLFGVIVLSNRSFGTPQGPLIPEEVLYAGKVGEMLIGLLTPAVAERIKKILEDPSKEQRATEALRNLSKRLDALSSARDIYTQNVLAYVATLQNPKSRDPLQAQSSAQHAADEMLRQLRMLQEAIQALSSGVKIFTRDSEFAIDAYIADKRYLIKGISNLEAMTPEQRSQFIEAFKLASGKFAIAMKDLTDFISRKADLQETVKQ